MARDHVPMRRRLSPTVAALLYRILTHADRLRVPLRGGLAGLVGAAAAVAVLVRLVVCAPAAAGLHPWALVDRAFLTSSRTLGGESPHGGIASRAICR